MNLASEVIKKVEGERRIEKPENSIPPEPEKKKSRLSLILFLGVFFVLASAGFFLWNFKFKNSIPAPAKPQANLSQRIKKSINKPLSQTSVQTITPGDSTVKVLVEQKADSVKNPVPISAQEIKPEKKVEAQTEKLLVQSSSAQRTSQGETVVQPSSEEKTDSKKMLSGALTQGAQPEKKSEPQTDKKPSSPKILSSKKTPALKTEKKLAEEKTSLPDKLVLSTPSTRTDSRPIAPSSAEENSQLAKNYFDFGVESQKKGNLQEAEECYLKALVLNSDFYPARLNLSTVYLERGKLAQAEKELTTLLSENQENTKTIYNFGLLYFKKKEFQKAIEYAQKLSNLNPDSPKAYLLMGKSLEAQDNIEEAIKAYARAYQIDPADPSTLYSLARANDLAGQKKEALTYYQLFLKNSGEKDSDLKRSVRERAAFLSSEGVRND
jgi:tetratricopeptide (TPR) repeat protein